jgi:hypothetical protein
MKMPRLGLVVFVSTLLSGCLYGQCMNGPCVLERERMIKSIKAYGEYWTKSGMTTESWRQDWVTCGGMSDGGYASDAPTGSAVNILLSAGKQKRQSIGSCMQSKGYEYGSGPW